MLAFTAPSARATTLTVDLSAPIRPVTHAASGSLYGVTETLPADVNALIAPLKPNMFTNPAANVQQPHGDAILVAARVAPIGARVTIRLADWFPSWPYAFTNVNDWFDKLAQTVSRKKAASVDNFYGYELWNEPNGTWTSSLSFKDFWQQSYAKLRELDPQAKLIGPSLAGYDANYMSDFLTFAKDNDCVPDIVSWHELSGADIGNSVRTYRALEQKLGVGPLPISINEYSGKDRIDDEGQPGASAPIIAKFERFQVDTACISYWDVPHPGRLGSLLASDTEPNGGWWFYKWYGDMSGTMVTTTPPSPNDSAALDGFASFDASTGTASVLAGGVNDGSIAFSVKGLQTVTALSQVHAVVEHTPFVNRTTSVSSPDTVSTADLTIQDGQISVSISKTNGTDGYRLSLTGLGKGGGGTAGAPGSAGAASSSGAAGRPALAGAGGAAGTLAQGGKTSTSAGGFGAASGTAGGTTPDRGGAAGEGATEGAGGMPSDGAQGGSIATGAAGRAGSAGAAFVSGGSAGRSDPSSSGASSAARSPTETNAPNCGCHAAGNTSRAGLVGAWLVVALFAWGRRAGAARKTWHAE